MKAKVLEISFNREWKGDHGMIYYHNIKFDNGEEGQFSTNKKEQNKFIVGQEVDYFVKSTTKNNTKMFDKEKPEFVKGSSSYNDPVEIKQTSMSVCQSAAVTMYELLNKKGKNESIQVVADKFHKWVISDGATKKNKSSHRWNAITRAVNQIKIMDEKLVQEHVANHTLTDDIINNATFFMKHVDAITQ